MENNFKYIFGVQENGNYSDSFETVNDLDVYYDNSTNKYLWSIDFTSPNLEESKTTKTLKYLVDKFHYYLDDNSLWNEYDLSNYWNGELSVANNLSDLFYGFRIFCNGYTCEVEE